MKTLILACLLVLMTAGTALAGGVSFQIGVGVPLFTYNYPAYSYPAPYAYYYSVPYRYYYPPAVVYGYSPYHGRVIIPRGYGHGYSGHGWGGYHYNHYGYGGGGYRYGRGYWR